MLRVLVGTALLASGPLAAAPILIDGSGWMRTLWGHVYLSGEGVYFSLALDGTARGNGKCRAGELCNITFQGGGSAYSPGSDETEIIGTYLGRPVPGDTFAETSVSFDGSVAVHWIPDPSDSNYFLTMPASVEWRGQIWIDTGGSGTRLNFTGSGPVQVGMEVHRDWGLVCPAPPGGWTGEPPPECFATTFRVLGLYGTFRGTLEEVPEPSTLSELGVTGLMALIVAVARNRKCLRADATAPSRPTRSA